MIQPQRARRVPPLVMGLLGMALMVAVLPSSLHTPITGPNGQAEVAPVPGQSRNQQNSFSQLGLASSGTSGSGGAGVVADGAATPTPQPGGGGGSTPNPSNRKPTTHPCVGGHQIPDPMSPPCTTWDGTDNGGRTYTGVTDKTITVYEMDHSYAGSQPYTDPVQPDDSPYVRTWKVLLQYFQNHFETYGRTVQVIPSYYKESSSDPAGSAVSAATTLASSSNPPFGVTGPYEGGWYETPLNTFAQHGMTTFAADMTIELDTESLPAQQQLSGMYPYFWSLQPTAEQMIASTADWICNSIQGRPAALSTDPAMQKRTRQIALLYGRDPNDPAQARQLDATTARLCSFHFAQILQLDDGTSTTPRTTAQQMFSDQNHGNTSDTSMLCWQCPVIPSQYMQQLTADNYHPETLFSAGDWDANFWARQSYSTVMANATGITWRWRQQPLPQSWWWQAYQEVDPNNSPDTFTGYTIYEDLMQIFGAIQMAGPDLTPQNVARGMQRWHSDDVAQGYNPRGGYQGGSASFIQDLMEERWDTTGVPPGGVQQDNNSAGNATGCYRMVELAKRHDDDWPNADLGAATDSSAPCTADDASNASASADAAPNQGRSS